MDTNKTKGNNMKHLKELLEKLLSMLLRLFLPFLFKVLDKKEDKFYNSI